MSFREDYMRGLDSLHEYAPYFYRIMRFLGVPVANYNIPTACVSYNPQSEVIQFEINPDLIKEMSDENVGFVIAHEAYHVLLKHLHETLMTDEYPENQVLVTAHECIANDNVQNVLGLDAPDLPLIFGEAFGADFSSFSTREAYDYLVEKEESSDSDQNSTESAEQGGSSSNSGTNDSSEGSSDSSDSSDSSSEGDSNIESDSGSDSDELDENANDSGKGDEDSQSGHGICGGIQIPEGYEQDFMNAVADALGEAVKESVKKKETIPDDIIDMIDDFEKETNRDILQGYSIGNNNSSMFMGSPDDMNLDWKALIAQINPKVMSSGKSKFRDSWHQPRRRMISSYPTVVLPTRVVKDDSKNDGDSTPTFILALDMSVSIPTYLIAGLANLADTVPDKFVKVIPVTWSDRVKEFDTKSRQIINRGGTNIDAVYEYSQKLAKKSGKQPYVFVITDGGCEFNSYWYNSSMSADKKVISDYWYWGAIDKRSIGDIKYNMGSYIDENNIYDVNDFLQ